jgi:hypothetical protein
VKPGIEFRVHLPFSSSWNALLIRETFDEVCVKSNTEKRSSERNKKSPTVKPGIEFRVHLPFSSSWNALLIRETFDEVCVKR